MYELQVILGNIYVFRWPTSTFPPNLSHKNILNLQLETVLSQQHTLFQNGLVARFELGISYFHPFPGSTIEQTELLGMSSLDPNLGSRDNRCTRGRWSCGNCTFPWMVIITCYCFLDWKWKSLRHVWLFVTHELQSMGFSRPKYWSG